MCTDPCLGQLYHCHLRHCLRSTRRVFEDDGSARNLPIVRHFFVRVCTNHIGAYRAITASDSGTTGAWQPTTPTAFDHLYHRAPAVVRVRRSTSWKPGIPKRSKLPSVVATHDQWVQNRLLVASVVIQGARVRRCINSSAELKVSLKTV